jgi:hypothetical protein
MTQTICYELGHSCNLTSVQSVQLATNRRLKRLQYSVSSKAACPTLVDCYSLGRVKLLADSKAFRLIIKEQGKSTKAFALTQTVSEMYADFLYGCGNSLETLELA